MPSAISGLAAEVCKHLIRPLLFNLKVPQIFPANLAFLTFPQSPPPAFTHFPFSPCFSSLLTEHARATPPLRPLDKNVTALRHPLPPLLPLTALFLFFLLLLLW